MTNRIIGIGIILLTIVSACGPKQYKSIGDQQIVVFADEHLHFAPGKFGDSIQGLADTTYRLMDGRILMKKIKLPVYDREVAASVKVTVASAGDRWDKSGSCFVIPAASTTNFISIHNGKAQLPLPLEGHENLKGIAPSGDYLPAVELMRFMTPFGVGFYNDKMDFTYSGASPPTFR